MTDAARAFIQADEYRYISPVFSFDPETGAVLELKSAALTNYPALDGMDAVTGHLRTCRMDSLGLQKKHQPDPLRAYRFPL